MITSLDLLTILIAGLMVGNEFAIAAFVHPALEVIGDGAHVVSAREVARRLGKAMPFWYGLVLALSIAEVVSRFRLFRHIDAMLASSAALWAVSIAFTIAALVPINNRIASGTETTATPRWTRDRQRWDKFHRWRVAVLTVALALLVLGILRSQPV